MPSGLKLCSLASLALIAGFLAGRTTGGEGCRAPSRLAEQADEIRDLRERLAIEEKLARSLSRGHEDLARTARSNLMLEHKALKQDATIKYYRALLGRLTEACGPELLDTLASDLGGAAWRDPLDLLSSLGAKARPVLPQLRRLLDQPGVSPRFQRAITGAIQQIEASK